MTVRNLVAKPLDLRTVGDIDDVRRDSQPLRQSRRLAQPLRFRQTARRDVTHRDIAGFRHQLADQLAAHSAAAAGDYRGPPSEFLHVCSSRGLLQGVEARNCRTNRLSARPDHSAAMGRVAKEYTPPGSRSTPLWLD